MQPQNYANLKYFSNWLKIKAKISYLINSSWTRTKEIKTYNENNSEIKKNETVLVVNKKIGGTGQKYMFCNQYFHSLNYCK